MQELSNHKKAKKSSSKYEPGGQSDSDGISSGDSSHSDEEKA